jgi:ubiquinone/menaquinone biosynthesis C-methylase UbiE
LIDERDQEGDGDGDTTHFGFQQVRVEEKESRVRAVFDSVADSYDVMNDLMSGGLHRLWKDHVASASNVREMAIACRKHQRQHQQELRILDVAGGTGDLSFRFVDAAECWVRTEQRSAQARLISTKSDS